MIPRRRTPVDAPAALLAWLEAMRDLAVGASTSTSTGAGAAIERFEEAFARFVGRRYAIAACSGRAALRAALRAAGIGEGDEIILPAYTLADLPAMLRREGIRPVFADIDPETYLLDPEQAARAVTPRTRAVLPTDLFGLPARWDERLRDLRGERGALIIEDAAHAIGSTIDGVPVGSRCDLAFFSLETIKVMHSFGGGVVVTDDEAVAASIRKSLSSALPGRAFVPKKLARNAVESLAFRTPLYQAALLALDEPRLRQALLALYDRVKRGGILTDFAYTGWQAAFARRQLTALPDRVRRRRDLARRMMDALEGCLVFPPEPPGVVSNRYFLVGRTDRDPAALRRALVRVGVDIGIHGEITDFCPPLTERARFPHADRAHRTLVQLPLYESMTDEDVQRVEEAVRGALDQPSSLAPAVLG